MSALGLLANYSSSDSEDLSESEHCSKRFKFAHHTTREHSQLRNQESRELYVKRLPLPSLFTKEDLKVPEDTDDPSKHNGRVRRFPHERGNWSSYIYVPYYAHENLSNLATKLYEECNVLGTFHISEDFHISVSKTFILRFHWINTFISSLRENLQDIHKFLIELGSVKIYTNDDNSRTFVGLKVNFGGDHLCSIVEKVDEALKEFGLPLFYQDPSFHISVVWCVGDKKKHLENILPKLQVILDKALDGEVKIHQMYVENLVCKTGNKVFTIDLK